MMAAMGEERLLAIIELQNAILAAAMGSDEVMHIVVDRAAQLVGGGGALVALVEGDDLVVRAATRGAGAAVGSKIGKAGTSGGRVPLVYGENTVGVLEVTGVKASDEDLETLRLLAQIIAIALHRTYTYPKPRLDVDHDPMTGLGSKRAFDERIAAELTRNKRYGHSFSLAMLDLEGFESAVDRHGQAAADEALREIARIIRSNTRAIDACFRIASDELAIVMPGTSLEGAVTVAERCRAQLESLRPFGGIIGGFVGVVQAGPDDTADALAARANTAVAADKQARR
jgi:diguanylate cyclase (GGDEF)-like protein